MGTNTWEHLHQKTKTFLAEAQTKFCDNPTEEHQTTVNYWMEQYQEINTKLEQAKVEQQTQTSCSHMFRFVRISNGPAIHALGQTRRKQIERCHKCEITRNV